MPVRRAKPADPSRQLMIKTKACERLIKEVDYYQREVRENEAKLAQMKEDNRDPYDVKKFEEVLGESHMMVPNSRERLRNALTDLRQLCESTEVTDEHRAGEWYAKAMQLLEQQNVSPQDHGEDGSLEATDVSGLKEGEAF